ncbi:MAG: divergent PAP2 family protein [Patescibacteria group bacterium]
MKLLIISATIIFISQSVKLLIYLSRGEHISRKMLSWVYVWTGEFPSTHSAVIAGAIYTIGRDDGLGLLFGFSVVIGLLLVYGLLEDKKRHEIFEEYLNESEDKAMQKIILDKKLLQFNGHTFADVIAGLMLGLVVAILMDLFIL